jgi:hypothetical protein
VSECLHLALVFEVLFWRNPRSSSMFSSAEPAESGMCQQRGEGNFNWSFNMKVDAAADGDTQSHRKKSKNIAIARPSIA